MGDNVFGMGAVSQVHPDRIDDLDRHEQVFRLRIAGHTLSSIAKQLGYADESGPYRVITREWDRRVHRPAEELRQLSLDRFEALWARQYAKFEKQEEPDLALIASMRKTLMDMARVAGLTNPKFILPVATQEDEATEAAPALPATPAAQLQSLLDKLRTRLAEQATPLEVVEHGPPNVTRVTSESTTDDVERTSGIGPQCNGPDEAKLDTVSKFDTVSNMDGSDIVRAHNLDEASLPKAPEEGG